MKLMNSIVMLTILCGCHLSFGGELNCKFEIPENSLRSVHVYTCEVTSLENPNDNLIITDYTGVHKENKSLIDVTEILIHDTITKYIPANIGHMMNLTDFAMFSSHLIEIRSKDFNAMPNLEDLDLSDNNLTKITSDAFTTLPSLRIIVLDGNQIEEIPNGIFSNNLNLEQLRLQNNNIKYISSGVFDKLPKLFSVRLAENTCGNKSYSRATGIIKLKDEIIVKCKNPNETPATINQSILEIQ